MGTTALGGENETRQSEALLHPLPENLVSVCTLAGGDALALFQKAPTLGIPLFQEEVQVDKFQAWLARERKMMQSPFYRFAVWLLDRLHTHHDINYTIETW